MTRRLALGLRLVLVGVLLAMSTGGAIAARPCDYAEVGRLASTLRRSPPPRPAPRSPRLARRCSPSVAARPRDRLVPKVVGPRAGPSPARPRPLPLLLGRLRR